MVFTRNKKTEGYRVLQDIDYRYLPENNCGSGNNCKAESCENCDKDAELTRIKCSKTCDIDKYTLDLYVPTADQSEKVCHTAVDNELTGCCNLIEEDENYYLEKKKCCNSIKQGNPYVQNEGNTTAECGRQSLPPVVIFVHGGGWKRGHKQAWKHYLSLYDTNILVAFLLQFASVYNNIGEMYAKNGITCAIISYPLGKTQPFWLLTETFISFLASTMFLGIVSMVLFGFLYTLMMTANLKRIIFQSYNSLPISGFVIYVLAVIAWTQILTYCIILWRRQSYKLTRIQSILPLLFIIKITTTLSYTQGLDFQSTVIVNCLLVICVVQGSIAYIQLTKIPEGCYSKQMESLGMAIKWVQTLGETTGVVNPNDIYLMGHSAGGHLVTMAALDEKCLSKTGCSRSDIKGVISLSGVYDISSLNTHALKNLYITPTFGEDKKTWTEASPLSLLDHDLPNDIPPFLVLCAEWDFKLADQAEEFANKLKQNGVLTKFQKISKTNHFTITVYVGNKWDSIAGLNVEQLCLNFIDDNISRLQKYVR